MPIQVEVPIHLNYTRWTTKYDDSKPSSYSVVTQAGVTGITRFTQKVRVVNGEQISYVYKTAITSLQEQFTNATKSSPKDDK